MIKSCRWLVWKNGAFLIRQNDISPLHIVAGKDDLSDGNLGLDVDDANLPGIIILSAHGLHQFFLPLEPRCVAGIVVGPDHKEPVPYADPFVLSTIEIHVVSACKSQLVVRLFAGDE